MGVYDKSYAQIKGEFELCKVSNKVVNNRIDGYNDYLNIINNIEGKSEQKLSEKDIINKVQIQSYVDAIENGLLWIEEQYRDAIWDRVINKKTWKNISDKYNYSEQVLRKNYQKYVYGVGTELGENFDK